MCDIFATGLIAEKLKPIKSTQKQSYEEYCYEPKSE